MRATVDAQAFSQALDKVSKVLKKSKIPVLQEVLVRVSEGRCILTGTDYDTWLTTELPAQGDDLAFVFHRTANAAKVCRNFDGDLLFELTEAGEGYRRHLKLCMSCGRRSGELLAFFPEDYPVIPALEPEHSFTVNAASLLERINRIKYATLKPGQDSAASHTSIHFGGDRIFCLDGFRAAWDTDESLAVPVPFMAAAAPLEHLKLFGKQEVSVRMDKRSIDISDGTLHLLFPRVLGKLYELDSAIPETFREEVYINPAEFLTELTYLKELIPAPRLYPVQFDNGKLLIQADGYRYQTEVQIDGHSETVIGFNPDHLIEPLKRFKGESRIRMKLNTPISPVILEAEGRSDHALVLPIRLKNNMAA